MTAKKLHLQKVETDPVSRVSQAVLLAQAKGVHVDEICRVLGILGDVSASLTDTLLVTRNAKGKGLFIKGLVYEGKLKHKP